MNFVVYTPHCFLRDGQDEVHHKDVGWEQKWDAVLLFEQDGHVWWTITFGMTRREVNDMCWQIGGDRPVFLMEHESVPGWFLSVDLPRLTEFVVDLIHERDASEWTDHYPAPLMPAED